MEERRRLLTFAGYLKENPKEAERLKNIWIKTIDEGGKWCVIPTGKDRYGIINYVVYILVDRDGKVVYKTPEVYCGGVYGMDRIFEGLYQAFVYLFYNTPYYQNYPKYTRYEFWV